MSRALVTATWDDIPHLDERAKSELLASYLPHELEARTKGLPSLGHGAVYPVAQSMYTVTPFPIPEYFPRAYGLDIGWNWTAAIWGALDRDHDTWYIYREYLRETAPPDVHAMAIQREGAWIKGVIDPSAEQANQKDGTRLLDTYRELGLHVSRAMNAVAAGTTEIWQRMVSNRLKIFSTCSGLLDDLRFYHRDENGRIVKTGDHRADALRYLIMSGKRVAGVELSKQKGADPLEPYYTTSSGPTSWMG